MYNEKDDIEQLFSKKFEKYEVKSSEQEWLELSGKLSKVNFQKFSLTSFNIYYLSVMIALAGTTTFLGIKNYQMARKIYHLESTLQSLQKKEQLLPQTDKPANYLEVQKSESVRETDATHVYVDPRGKEKIENEKAKPKFNAAEKVGSNSKVQISTPAINQEFQNQQDLAIKEANLKPTESTNKPDSVSQPRIKKVVKRTFVIKQKTVVVKDTVIVTKGIK